MDLRVADGHVYTDGEVRRADVGVRDGVIEEIGDVEADRVVDASGALVLPGLVNAHTHASMSLLRGYADDLPLQRWLEEKIWPAETQLQPDDVYAGARLAALEMIRSGTTAFGDMYFHMDRVASAVEESGLRANLGYGIITEGKPRDEARKEFRDAVEFVREYDGGGRVNAMITPHAPYTCSPWVFREAKEAAEELGCTLHTHISETEDEVEQCVAEHGSRPAWHLDEQNFLGDHTYVAHGVHLDNEEIGLLGDRGVAVAHCPSANMKLASGSAPVGEMLERDVPVAVGTDGPASNNDLDMFEETRLAALLAKLTTKDASIVPAATALEMATRNGAYALGLNSGAIERGRPADLVVVDLDAAHLTPGHDLVSHAVYSAKGSDVRTTIVGGDVLMEEREVLSLDEDEVLEEAQEAATDLVGRIDREAD